MWDINEQTRKTNKKKKHLINTDNSMVITTGRAVGGVVRGKGEHVYGDRR